MRRSTAAALAGLEIGTLSWMLLGAQFETGLDALTYHRMANAIVQDGFAPWTLSPLSYIGMYPGSDSSGVPFLAASFSLLAGINVSAVVLVYDSVLLAVFGVGLFLLVSKLVQRTDVALLAVLMGSLAYGFFTSVNWSLDERSFNVALAPVFLILVLPRGTPRQPWWSEPSLPSVGLVSLLMFVSHLNFLLLLPFLLLVPLLCQVIDHRYAARRKRWASVVYFGVIGLSPLLFLAALSLTGVLAGYGLQYQLENSALFSGDSPFMFLANAFVFLGTRVGAVNLALAFLGLAVLATRPRLLQRDVLLGALVLAGFIGLPVVIYSKDLLTPVFVVIGAVALSRVIVRTPRRQVLAALLAGVLILTGSVVFDTWNSARTSRAFEARFWAPAGVTPEMQDAGMWLDADNPGHGCAYGNNPALLQQVTNDPGVPFCTGLAIDVMINGRDTGAGLSQPFHATFVGINGANPSDWFTSPELAQVSADFTRLPNLDYQSGRALLLRYNVGFIVIDLKRPFQIPLYEFQGVHSSLFLEQLWASQYPIYRSGVLAVFRLSS